MKDIKEKPVGRTVRTPSPLKRLPKTLSRKALLTAKERTRAAVQDAVTEKQSESPENYATDTAMETGERVIHDAGRASYTLGKKLAQKAVYTIKKRRTVQRVREGAGQTKAVYFNGVKVSEPKTSSSLETTRARIGETYYSSNGIYMEATWKAM